VRAGDRASAGVNPEHYLDTAGMWDATVGAPEQALAAVADAGEVLVHAVLPSGDDIRSVVVFGVGTSATAAGLVSAHGAAHASIPIVVSSGYVAPSFVGPHTLAFALSYDGDTEETCATARAVAERGAHMVTVSGGGALASLATTLDQPRFRVPTTLPAARTALGSLAIPVLLTLSRLGVIPDVGPSLAAALSALQRRRDALLAPGGPAGEVARQIGRTIPLVYGSTGVTAVAARRWKTQINENAKTPAFFAVQPDLSHNEVAGWGQHGDVTRQVLSLVTLRHSGEHPQVARRFDLVVEATDEVMANIIPVWAEGDDDLARFFDLALFGDLVSLHMAGREGIDPGPVPALSDVESELRR
jgi:glucose/mannose-6-phosphate isomerase